MGQFALVAFALGSSALAAGATYRRGKIEQLQYKQQAAQEGDAAKQREIDRKRNLLKALASQRATAAALGAEFSGSLSNLAQVDIEEAATDLSVDQLNSARRQRALRLASSESARAGTVQAGASLLDTGVKTYGGLA